MKPLRKYTGIERRWIRNNVSIVIALVMWWYLNRTAPGLRLRAVGENPGSADSVGINVKRSKYLHIMLGCGIMGLGLYRFGCRRRIL